MSDISGMSLDRGRLRFDYVACGARGIATWSCVSLTREEEKIDERE